MDKKLSILLLPDHLEWSAFQRCQYIKKYLSNDIDFEILGGLDKETYLNINKIAAPFDFIHINFTGSLQYYFNFCEKNYHKTLITIINERSLLDKFEIDIDKANKMIYSACGVTSVGYKIADIYRGVEYIPNGVDLIDDFKSPKRIIVGYSGTKRPNKNVQLLEKVCNDLGLELRTATHEGTRIPHEDIHQFYKQLDVFIHPSLTEGCSNPVLEALAMQVPTLMTRQGIWREFEGYVEFFEPNYNDLYSKLKKYTSRKLIAEKFDWKDICARYKMFYNRSYERQKQMLKDKNE